MEYKASEELNFIEEGHYKQARKFIDKYGVNAFKSKKTELLNKFKEIEGTLQELGSILNTPKYKEMVKKFNKKRFAELMDLALKDSGKKQVTKSGSWRRA